jgi:hypothetical protein
MKDSTGVGIVEDCRVVDAAVNLMEQLEGVNPLRHRALMGQYINDLDAYGDNFYNGTLEASRGFIAAISLLYPRGIGIPEKQVTIQGIGTDTKQSYSEIPLVERVDMLFKDSVRDPDQDVIKNVWRNAYEDFLLQYPEKFEKAPEIAAQAVSDFCMDNLNFSLYARHLRTGYFI